MDLLHNSKKMKYVIFIKKYNILTYHLKYADFRN